MKTRRRLTREESKEVTRMRLIEPAERLFIQKGFDEASVEEISEAAGYSRGAFYSNFDDKDQVLLAVIDHRRPKAIDDIFPQSFDPAERMAAVRQWFSNQWRLKDFIALRMEFSRRARRDRTVRTHLADLRRHGSDPKSSHSCCWPLHTAWRVSPSKRSLNGNTFTRRQPGWCSID